MQIRFLDHFDDPVEAARAYDVAVLEWRGDKAVTNFPAETYFGEGVRSMDAEDSSKASKAPAETAPTTQRGSTAQLDPSAQERAVRGQLASETAPTERAMATSSKAAVEDRDVPAQRQGKSTKPAATESPDLVSRSETSAASSAASAVSLAKVSVRICRLILPAALSASVHVCDCFQSVLNTLVFCTRR